MTRLFITPFLYQQQSYIAEVSVTDDKGGQVVTIFLPDESLHETLPEGRFRFDGKKELALDYPQLSPIQELLFSVLVAIEQHNATHTHTQFPK